MWCGVFLLLTTCRTLVRVLWLRTISAPLRRPVRLTRWWKDLLRIVWLGGLAWKKLTLALLTVIIWLLAVSLVTLRYVVRRPGWLRLVLTWGVLPGRRVIVVIIRV